MKSTAHLEARHSLDHALHQAAALNAMPELGYDLAESFRALLQQLQRQLLSDPHLQVVTGGSIAHRTALTSSDADFKVLNTVAITRRERRHTVEAGVQRACQALGLPVMGDVITGRTVSKFRLGLASDGGGSGSDLLGTSMEDTPADNGNLHVTRSGAGGGSSSSGSGPAMVIDGSGSGSGSSGGNGQAGSAGAAPCVFSFDLLFQEASFGRPSRKRDSRHSEHSSMCKFCGRQNPTASNQSVQQRFDAHSLQLVSRLKAFRTAAMVLRLFMHEARSVGRMESYEVRALAMVATQQLLILRNEQKKRNAELQEQQQQQQQQQPQPILAIDIFQHALLVLYRCSSADKLHDMLAQFVGFPVDEMVHCGSIICYTNAAKHTLALLRRTERALASADTPSPEARDRLVRLFIQDLTPPVSSEQQPAPRAASQGSEPAWAVRLAAQLADQDHIAGFCSAVTVEVLEAAEADRQARLARGAASRLVGLSMPRPPRMKHSRSGSDSGSYDSYDEG
ncbi:MAG: hypothetical protein WDW38_006230 [Sanguina aurantia]